MVVSPPPPFPPLDGSFSRPSQLSSRCSEGTKGAQRKIFSTLHPNTILKPNPDPNARPSPKLSPNPNPTSTPNPRPNPSPGPNASPNPNPNPNPSSNPRLGLELVLGVQNGEQ